MNKSKSGSRPNSMQNENNSISFQSMDQEMKSLPVSESSIVLREAMNSSGYRADQRDNRPSVDSEEGTERAKTLIDGIAAFRDRNNTNKSSGKKRNAKTKDKDSTPAAPNEKDSALQIYLNEIGRIPLLTPKQEVELAARYRNGDESAKEKMVVANLRLVVKIARDYENLGLPILDLISEGNIGLIKAVERFDPDKGGKLSTYGSWWIKQSIKRALANQSKTIRLPVHLVDKISKMRRVISELHEKLGREATDEEIASIIKIPVHKVSHWKNVSLNPASLDAPIGNDEQNSFSEVVEDETANTPYQELEEKTVAHMIRSLLSRLPERENFILTYRYGLDGDGEKTLEEVGTKFGITRERVRQIQNAALEKMRRDLERLESEGVAA